MAERDTRFGGNLETANTRPRVSNEVRGWHRMSNQPRLDSMNSGLFSARINDPSVNEMRNNYTLTSRNPNTWHQSPYFGMGGYDFVKDHAPTLENLAFFQDIKDKDAMARDINFQVTLPEHEKLSKFSGYKLLPKGFYPYGNPSWIENEPSYGLDYMMDIPLGGKGQLGFRKNINDENYNAYLNLLWRRNG